MITGCCLNFFIKLTAYLENPMLKRLSSLNLTFWSLLTLVSFLVCGIFLCLDPYYKSAIDGLNHHLLVQWLGHHLEKHPLICVWVLGICMASGLLMVNALACTLTAQLTAARRSRSRRRWFFFGAHLLFILVLGCHGITLVSGTRYGSITLYPGETHRLDKTTTIELVRTVYVDDPALLKMEMKKSRRLMTRETFHMKENRAYIKLSREGKPDMIKTVKFLKPLVSGALRVTLTTFRPDTAGKGIGVTVTAGKIPLVPLFFTAYALLILALGGLLITGRRNGEDRYKD